MPYRDCSFILIDCAAQTAKSILLVGITSSYIHQDRAVVAQAALGSRMPLPMGAVDEKLCRPPPPGTPATMEPSALRYNELKNTTGFDFSVILHSPCKCYFHN